MAFSDVIDQPNADGCLLGALRPKNTSGVDQDIIYFSERSILTFTIVPGQSGPVRYIPIVAAWGDFGYVAAELPAYVISDGSVMFSNTRAFGPAALTGGSWAELLSDYELVGADLWVGQMLTEIVAGSKNYRVRLIFSGVVSEVGGLTKETFELFFADGTARVGVMPPTEITRVDFPDAPDESIGKPIPIIFGDFSEAASGYTGIDPEDMQEAGLGNLAGVPAVMVNKNLDDYLKGPEYRVCSHASYDLSGDHGVTLLEPEEEVPGRVHPDDFQITNAAWTQIHTDWPMRVKFPVRPDGRGTTYTTGLNHMLACDGDPATYVALGNDPGYAGWCTVALRNVPQLGHIQEVQVCAWVFDGSGYVRLGLGDSSGYYPTGQYTEVTFTGNEQICRHTVSLPTTGWPSDGWNFGDYQLMFQMPVDTHVAKIREMWLLVTYVPNRVPLPKPVRVDSGGGGGTLGSFEESVSPSQPVYVTPPTTSIHWWPSHNPTFLTYPKGRKDDSSGTYTGSANSLIENGADIAHCLLAEYSSLTAAQIETGSTASGNFPTARTKLGSYHKLAAFTGEKTPVRKQFELLCRECRAMPTWNSDGKLGMVVIEPSPAANYRGTSDVFDFVPDVHFYADSFRCWRTSIDQIASKVFIDFDYCHGLGRFRKTAFITPDGTDNGFGTDDDATRKTQAGHAEACYGAEREFRLSAYDVRTQGLAKSLRNFYFDMLRHPRVGFEFECGIHACDLSVGNVLRFGVERIHGMKVPSCHVSGAENWDDFLWYVTGVTRLESDNDVSRYLIRGVEAIEPDVASHWVAAADDT